MDQRSLQLGSCKQNTLQYNHITFCTRSMSRSRNRNVFICPIAIAQHGRHYKITRVISVCVGGDSVSALSRLHF